MDRINECPTLLRQQIVTIDPEVCDTSLGHTRVRYPGGGGQVIDDNYKDDPMALRDLLFGWLSAHINAVAKEPDDV